MPEKIDSAFCTNVSAAFVLLSNDNPTDMPRLTTYNEFVCYKEESSGTAQTDIAMQFSFDVEFQVDDARNQLEYPYNSPALTAKALPSASAKVKYLQLTNKIMANWQAARIRIRKHLEEIGRSNRSIIFTSSVYRTSLTDERATMQMLYRYFYQLRVEREWKLCDRIIDDLEVQRLSPTLLIAILTITAPMKELRNRRAFYERANARISELRGFEICKKLLAGLE